MPVTRAEVLVYDGTTDSRVLLEPIIMHDDFRTHLIACDETAHIALCKVRPIGVFGGNQLCLVADDDELEQQVVEVTFWVVRWVEV